MKLSYNQASALTELNNGGVLLYQGNEFIIKKGVGFCPIYKSTADSIIKNHLVTEIEKNKWGISKLGIITLGKHEVTK